MDSTKTDFFTSIGLEAVPWTVRVYLLLIAFFLSLRLATAFLDSSTSLCVLAEDGLKMILGALLGSLALIRERRDDRPPKNDGVG